MQFGLLRFSSLKSIPPVMPSAWQRQSDAAALRVSRVCDYTRRILFDRAYTTPRGSQQSLTVVVQYTFFLRQLIYHSAAAPPLK